MIAPLSSQNSALSLLKSAGAGLLKNTALKSAAQEGQTQAGSPMQGLLDKLSPEKAGELKKKLEESQDLLKKLESGRSDMSEERKAAAAEKVRQIKEKLKVIRMLATVNPEAAARQAAQLSRELAAAVKEYAGASGGSASTGDAAAMQSGTGGMNVSGVDGAATTQTEGAQQQVSGLSMQDSAAMDAGDVAQDADGALATPETTGASESDNQNGDDGAYGASLPEDESDEPGAPTDLKEAGEEDNQARQAEEESETAQDNPADQDDEESDQNNQTLRERIQAEMAQASAAYAASRVDSEFANEVRQIKDTLKNILETAKRKLEDGDDPATEADIRDGENALRDVEQSLNSLSSSVLPIGGQMAVSTAGVTAVNLFA